VNWHWEPDGEPEYVHVVLGGHGAGALITTEGDVAMFGWPISGSFREAAASVLE